MFRYNSRNIFYKSPFGAVPAGEHITFRIQSKEGIFVEEMRLCIQRDGGHEIYYPMTFKGKDGVWSTFETSVNVNNRGLYWYRFLAKTPQGEICLYKGANGNIAYKGGSYQLTVYDRDYVTPEAAKGGVIYHIFADRFAKGEDSDAVWSKNGVLKEWHEPVTIADSDGVFRANDFYGGNLQGIIDKLDYLVDLGVTMIYLSPIFKSASNHRYDTGDYMQIDELLGSDESFRRLLSEAKKRGIGIMLDGVFNHTGSDSLYFNKYGNYPSLGAYQSKESPYYRWYSFSRYPDEYACWWGITVTPTVNKTNPMYRQFILGKDGVLDKWTRYGLAGWRLDVVDELDIGFVNDIRTAVKSVDKNVTVIGEVWEDASNKIAYSKRRPYLLGSQLDGVMNYPYKDAILKYTADHDINDFIDRIMTIYENYPLQSLNSSMNFLGTHDTVRAINSLSTHKIDGTTKEERLHIKLSAAERAVARERLKVAAVLQYMLPGIPSVYYGDEIGLEGYEDPINRKPFPWDDMDYDMLEHYQALGRLRKTYRQAFKGGMSISAVGDVLLIERESGGQKVVLIMNWSAKTFPVPERYKKSKVLMSHHFARWHISACGYAIVVDGEQIK